MVFEVRGKRTEYLEKNLSEQEREPTTNVNISDSVWGSTNCLTYLCRNDMELYHKRVG